MNDFSDIINVLDFMTNSTRKKHIVGGVLLSVALLFGGLAFTAMTIKIEEDTNDEF